MKVYIYRHTDAEAGEPDEDRVLSNKGFRQARELAQFIPEQQFEEISEIWHSPLIRAHQTVEIFKKHVDSLHDIEMHAVEELSPDAEVEDLGKLLGECEGDVILCGHSPFLDELLTALCVGEPGQGLINLKKGGMVCLERTCDRNQHLPMGFWTIEWYVVPKLL